jgi:pentatricopeptide repeat protein
MKDVKITVDEVAKTNSLVDVGQVREAIRMCEELQATGIVPAKGVGYRLTSPFTTNRRTSRNRNQRARANIR